MYFKSDKSATLDWILDKVDLGLFPKIFYPNDETGAGTIQRAGCLLPGDRLRLLN